jgi:hypothetical protein
LEALRELEGEGGVSARATRFVPEIQSLPLHVELHHVRDIDRDRDEKRA